MHEWKTATSSLAFLPPLAAAGFERPRGIGCILAPSWPGCCLETLCLALLIAVAFETSCLCGQQNPALHQGNRQIPSAATDSAKLAAEGDGANRGTSISMKAGQRHMGADDGHSVGSNATSDASAHATPQKRAGGQDQREPHLPVSCTKHVLRRVGSMRLL
jgi:hypothetical protein